MTPNAAPALRPMSIGDMVDVAFHLYRDNFVRFLATTLAVHAFTYTALNASQAVMSTWLMAALKKGAGVEPRDLVPFLTGLAVYLVAAVLYVIGYQIVSAALAWGTGKLYLGETFDVAQAYRAVFARLSTLVGTWFLLGLAFAGIVLLAVMATVLVGTAGRQFLGSIGAVLFALPVGIGGVGVILWAGVRLVLATPVAMIEPVGAVDAIRRSWRLTGGSVGEGIFGSQVLRASILLLLVFIVTITLSTAGSGPKLVATAFYAGIDNLKSGLNPGAVPLAVLLPLSLLELLVQAVILPFSMMAVVLFYFDARIRREGLDLELLAARSP